jgi:pimeloyl-ACP methyl ester carboxylesterase
MILRDGRLRRPDGRVIAWTECGLATGFPILRIPGTPGSRIPIRPDAVPWTSRGLRMITVERPGFGASTRLPDHGFMEHADDLAALLDHLGIEAVAAIAGSGGAPYLLALMAAHHKRVLAASVVMGMAPVTAEEIDGLIPLNASFLRFVRDGDVRRLRDLLNDARDAMLSDPVARLLNSTSSAPPSDREVVADPAFQQAYERSTVEALRQGVDGWVDECLAIGGSWSDVRPEAIATRITWWHAKHDRNAPLTAAQRLVGRLASAELRVWTEGGHFIAFHKEGELLDELLLRAGCSGPAP